VANRKTVPSFSEFVNSVQLTENKQTKTNQPRQIQKAEKVDNASENITKIVMPQIDSILELEERVNQLVSNPIYETIKSEDIESTAINESLNSEFTGYRILRDKDETFECKISVEGTTLNEAKARLVMDAEPWNLTFYGKIYPDGRCVIPLKKGIPLSEGSSGKIRLEVIAEDQLFVGWENDFIVEIAKKLNVEVKEQKKVSVSFNSAG